MFGKQGSGMGQMAKLLGDLPKIQKVVQKSLDDFSNQTIRESFQSGLVTIESKGDVTKSIEFSDEMIEMLKEEQEMAQDIIVASLSAMSAKINELRLQKLENDAKNSGLNPKLVSQVFNNELIGNLM